MPDAVMQALNELIPMVLYVVALLAAYYIKVVWQPRIMAYIDAHVNEKTQKLILTLGQQAYAYAETVFRTQNGADKLKAALSFFNSNMSRYGLTNINDATVRAAIEKAWIEQWGQAPIKPAEAPAANELISVSQAKQLLDALAARSPEA